MKKSSIISLLLLLGMLSCLDPGRDNPYDPENPDIAELGGTVFGIDYLPVEGSTIKLMQDTIIIDETESDVTGWYELTGIIPDTYKLIAEADLYTCLEYDLDIAAGTRNDSFDLHFEEIFFDFEDEPLGPNPPRGFLIRSGQWDIIQDNTDPGLHSAPNVFRGINTHGAEPFAQTVFKEPIKDFWMDARFKYDLISSVGLGAAGFVLRAQDEHNFYLLLLDVDALGLWVVMGDTFHHQPLALDTTVVFLPDTWYCMAADFHENELYVYVNENEVFHLQDNTFQQGFVGLCVKSWQAGGHSAVHFDDVGIWP
jgi:hypothetical protein